VPFLRSVINNGSTMTSHFSITRRLSGSRMLLVASFVVAGAILVFHLDAHQDLFAFAQEAREDPWVLGVILILYVAVMALPFVPGAEIGLLLLALLGACMAVPVYLATVAALTLAFSIGQFAPRVILPGRGGRMAIPPGSPRIRDLDKMKAGLLSRRLRLLTKHRWLALVVLFNMPGNTVLGGGGGIAMMAGITGAFTFGSFILGVAIAVAPVPLAVIVADYFDAGAAVTGWLYAAIDAYGLRSGLE